MDGFRRREAYVVSAMMNHHLPTLALMIVPSSSPRIQMGEPSSSSSRVSMLLSFDEKRMVFGGNSAANVSRSTLRCTNLGELLLTSYDTVCVALVLTSVTKPLKHHKS